MSWGKAMAAGAKQQAKTAAAEAKAKPTKVHKTFGGKCAIAGCGNSATVRRGKHNYCRTHGAELD